MNYKSRIANACERKSKEDDTRTRESRRACARFATDDAVILSDSPPCPISQVSRRDRRIACGLFLVPTHWQSFLPARNDDSDRGCERDVTRYTSIERRTYCGSRGCHKILRDTCIRQIDDVAVRPRSKSTHVHSTLARPMKYVRNGRIPSSSQTQSRA